VPEGDTIWRTAAGVRARVGGQVVSAAWPERFAALVGRTLEAVDPVGKHLLMRFSGGLTLHSHMRMIGSWHLYRPGERWRAPRHRARAVLTFGDWEAVCFSAPVIDLVREGIGRSHRVRAPEDDAALRRWNLPEPVRHLGPDILADDFPLDVVVARARSAGPVALGELLLDQRVCAGIGNVYRCEALWELRRDPWTSSADLTDEELAGLYAAARRHLRANVSRSAPRRFDGRPPAVHARGGRPCPRCGTRISTMAQGADARITYWCGTCQKSLKR
jgi:endonuclease-8